MTYIVVKGLLIPFLGTALGSALVFFMKKELDSRIQKILSGFAAGVMIYVVVEELVPEMAEGEHSNWGTITFMLGFALMMILDVVLG